MRAGVLTMGPLLARYPQKKIKVALGGGCALGVRDTNWHLAGFRSLGARNTFRQRLCKYFNKKRFNRKQVIINFQKLLLQELQI